MTSPNTRVEADTLGEVTVEADRYWGAQTQRALENFAIGDERLPRAFIRALGLVKQACAQTNVELGTIADDIGAAIADAAADVAAGKLDGHFPLPVWQTGSGTQTNMNANEVIANLAIERLGGTLGSKHPVHPNDHVNRSQSSNDVIPTATQLAIALQITERLVPAVRRLRATLSDAADRHASIIKTGRTHLQDAVPISLGQEYSAWVAQLEGALSSIEGSLPAICALPVGGTAVGTGLNAPADFGTRVSKRLADATRLPVVSASNKFAAIAAHDAVVAAHAGLKVLALALHKLANDVRWLASGPRCGLGELRLPANEPGSSIMPGKVNPTQCEALIMVCLQVMGNDATVTMAGSSGNFQLNTCKPLLAYLTLQSIQLLADATESFDRNCARGIEPVTVQIGAHLRASLMLVTALVPHVGYDAAAKVANEALASGEDLRDAAVRLRVCSAEEFDQWVDPAAMTRA